MIPLYISTSVAKLYTFSFYRFVSIVRCDASWPQNNMHFSFITRSCTYTTHDIYLIVCCFQQGYPFRNMFCCIPFEVDGNVIFLFMSSLYKKTSAMFSTRVVNILPKFRKVMTFITLQTTVPSNSAFLMIIRNFL